MELGDRIPCRKTCRTCAWGTLFDALIHSCTTDDLIVIRKERCNALLLKAEGHANKTPARWSNYLRGCEIPSRFNFTQSAVKGHLKRN